MNGSEGTDRYLRANRETWDAWTRLHVGSAFYDVDGFRAGRCTLDSIELEGVGEVRGRSLLHLQCHFGLGTLSWARLGARATGVDFSGEAIAAARGLARETGLDARFVQSDLYNLPGTLEGLFDVVFTSYGVLPWLPDLEAWGKVVARYLKPGGLFFIAEGHPLAMAVDDRPGAEGLHVFYPYFRRDEPMRFQERGSYAVPDAPIESVTYEWFHSLSEILGALLNAGLRILSFREYPLAAWQMFPCLVRDANGFWTFPEGALQIPLTYTIQATR